MGSFTGTVTGKVTIEGLDASNERIDEDSLLSGVIDGHGDYSDATIVSATVDIEFEFRETGVETDDPENFDPEAYIEEAVTAYGTTIRVSRAEFEVDDAPEAFDVIESHVNDRELALAIYAELSEKGLLA